MGRGRAISVLWGNDLGKGGWEAEASQDSTIRWQALWQAACLLPLALASCWRGWGRAPGGAGKHGRGAGRRWRGCHGKSSFIFPIRGRREVLRQSTRYAQDSLSLHEGDTLVGVVELKKGTYFFIPLNMSKRTTYE
jgi:hypothetical protein